MMGVTEGLGLQISGLIKDIDYLREMKKIEESLDRAAMKGETVPLSLSHVVPISGLFLSCFYRLENELKTVLELWAPESIPLLSGLVLFIAQFN
jgi:hypothetical protein